MEKLLYFKQQNRRKKRTDFCRFFPPFNGGVELPWYLKLVFVCTYLCSTCGGCEGNSIMCSQRSRGFITMEGSGYQSPVPVNESLAPEVFNNHTMEQFQHKFHYAGTISGQTQWWMDPYHHPFLLTTQITRYCYRSFHAEEVHNLICASCTPELSGRDYSLEFMLKTFKTTWQCTKGFILNSWEHP